MSDDINDESFGGQLDKAMEILSKDEEPKEESEESRDLLPSPETDETGAEEPTGEEKPNAEGQVEPETAIEPPASWRSDEKELFKALPRETQEVIQRLQQSSDAHFTQRSTELAQKIRATDDERQQCQADRARYAQELQHLNQLATQLLPAKFSDIRSEADYLRLKATDPARASEFEAFQQILARSKQDAARVSQSQLNDRLNREWMAFVGKYPEFQDTTKANTMMAGIRKGAQEYYGYSPEETKIIPDHRQIVVMRDALAYRQLLANQKAMAAKKASPAPKKVLKPTANVASSDGSSALLNRARKAQSFNDKVDAITRYLQSA